MRTPFAEYLGHKKLDENNLTLRQIEDLYNDSYSRGYADGAVTGKTLGMEFAANLLDQMAYRESKGVAI
jgi:hypothetical protein